MQNTILSSTCALMAPPRPRLPVGKYSQSSYTMLAQFWS